MENSIQESNKNLFPKAREFVSVQSPQEGKESWEDQGGKAPEHGAEVWGQEHPAPARPGAAAHEPRAGNYLDTIKCDSFV